MSENQTDSTLTSTDTLYREQPCWHTVHVVLQREGALAICIVLENRGKSSLTEATDRLPDEQLSIRP
jgi:hypothetical protein